VPKAKSKVSNVQHQLNWVLQEQKLSKHIFRVNLDPIFNRPAPVRKARTRTSRTAATATTATTDTTTTTTTSTTTNETKEVQESTTGDIATTSTLDATPANGSSTKPTEDAAPSETTSMLERWRISSHDFNFLFADQSTKQPSDQDDESEDSDSDSDLEPEPGMHCSALSRGPLMLRRHAEQKRRDMLVQYHEYVYGSLEWVKDEQKRKEKEVRLGFYRCCARVSLPPSSET